MNFFSAVVLALVAADVDSPLSVGTQLRYQGTIAKTDRDGGRQAAEKAFDLTFFISRADADGVEYYWLLDERGAGGFSWFDRIGRGSQNAEGAVVGQGPALLYDYGKGKHVVLLASPKF